MTSQEMVEGSGRLQRALEEAAAHEAPWSVRVGKAISALLAAVTAQPKLAELCLEDAYAEPGPAGPIKPTLVTALAAVLKPPRREVAGPCPPPGTEELMAIGIVAVLAERLRRGESDTLPGLSEELTELAIRPFSARAAD